MAAAVYEARTEELRVRLNPMKLPTLGNFKWFTPMLLVYPF